MIFEADTDQIKKLDSLTLVQLMKRLMLTECRLVEIPLRAVTVPLQITVADGGEDGRVEWTGGVDETDYFPTRFCVFQAKAKNLTKASITAEVLEHRKGCKARLNPAVLEVLSRHGAYIVFCSHPFTGRKCKTLRQAIVSAIRETGGDPDEALAIEVYDANRIADWVNTHPSVALWLAAHSRRRSVAGFLTHEGWGRAAEISIIPWIDDDKARFAPVNVVIPQTERQDRHQNAWTFYQAAQAALTYLTEDKVAVRIVGPSGFGKSRFAYEIFNRRATSTDEIENAAVIYTDLTIAGDEVPKLALELADSGSPTILVVDECPDDTHGKFVTLAKRAGSRLRLVTIDVETRFVQPIDTLTIQLEPAADEQIGAIAKAIAPKLGDSDLRLIKKLSQGFPHMAILAAQQNAGGRETIQSVEQFLDRIIWGRKRRIDEAQKVLELASLFEWVGLTERVGNHALFIAREFAGLPEDTFIEHLKSFKSRGIVTQRGDYLQVGPIPLAARLGARRLSLLPDGQLVSIFANAPAALKEGLLRRLRWLDTVPEARAFAQTLLSPECFGSLDALNTDFGANCLDRLVHVDPDLAMATINRVFGGLTIEQLRAVDAGRRYLVWALEKLVFRKESFDSAATLLRRLAAAETEDQISNNATGKFKQLYQIYLSGTEAGLSARLLVIDDGLRSSDHKEREVCLEALDEMLGTHHFSRGGGAEEIGSGERLKDWVPKTYSDIHDFFRAALTRLTKLVVSDDPLASQAKQCLGSRIRGLINQLPLDEIREMINRITARYGFWPEAVQEVNEWLYFDRIEASKEKGTEVRSYFDELMPSDPVDLVVLYTYGWQADFHDPDQDYDREEKSGHDFDYATRKAAELAKPIAADSAAIDRILDRLAVGDAKTVFPFARRLAQLMPDPVAVFRSALAKAEADSTEANRQFFGGLIAGADDRDPETARACVRAALNSPKLKDSAIAMIGAGKLQRRDIELVVSLLRSGDVEPWQCASLSYGRGMDHLPAKVIVLLLDELSKHGADGLWTSLDIITMFLHGGRKPAKSILRSLKSILVAPNLLDKSLRGTVDGYHLKEMVGLLDRHGAINARFARVLTAQLFGICDRSRQNVFYTLDDPVREALITLMKRHPREVWVEVSRLLTSNDMLRRDQFDALVDAKHDDHLGPGLLFELPTELYLDWIRKDPRKRAAKTIKWLPIVIKSEDGPLTWHSALEDFVAEFGEEDNVLDELSARLHPRSWSGSLVPHLEPLVVLIGSWVSHPTPKVRQWAHRQVTSLKTMIDRESQRDEEQVVRYS